MDNELLFTALLSMLIGVLMGAVAAVSLCDEMMAVPAPVASMRAA